MKVHELIALLQKEDPGTEVRFSESYVSQTARPGERLSCGPEEGSQILEVMSESTGYVGSDDRKKYVVLLGEILSEVPGPHFAPFEDEGGSQPLVKEADRKHDRIRRCISFLRKPSQLRTEASMVSKAHRLKYGDFIRKLKEYKSHAGMVIIAAPWVLGDDYEELVTNMNLIAKAEMVLAVGTLDTDDHPDVVSFPKFKD